MSEVTDKNEKRNFTFNVLESGFWVMGGSFLSSQIVLPALLTRLGGSNFEIGILGTIIYLGLFLPQIFAAKYGQSLIWKKPIVLQLGALQRFMFLLIGLSVLILGNDNRQTALMLILFLFTINQIILGINTPIWFDLITKITPLQKRGKLNGFRNLFSGFLSLIASILLTWVLSSFQFPINYALAAFIGFVFQFSALGFQAQLVEEVSNAVSSIQPMKEYLQQLRNIASSNRPFRMFLIASMFLILATTPVGFFTAYAIKHFHATEGMIGTFTALTVIGQITGAMANGYLSDRYGNKIALISASLAILGSTLLALFAPNIWWFSISYVCVGIFLGSEMMTRYNLAVEYGPIHQRAIYIGLMNTLLAPFYFSGMVAGALSDRYSYELIFILGIVFSAVGLGLLAAKVKEPRTLSIIH